MVASSALQRVLQVIATFPHPIAALAWSAQGKLAVGAGTTVYLYEPEGSDSSSLRWRYACMLEQGTEVAALAWSPAEEHMLAVCGEEVTLWNVDNTTREWSVRSGDAVSQCAFSPDGHYLATVAQYQPLVKIWYQRDKNERRRRSIYLAHPRSILSISWRPRVCRQRNVLLTVSRDGVGRLWMQSETKPQGTGPKFDVRAVLDAPTSPGVEWLQSLQSTTTTTSAAPPTDTATVAGASEFGRYARRPLETADELDFLCGVSDTGGLTIWRLCSNSESSTHAPSVSLTMQLDMGLGAIGRRVVRVWAVCGMWGARGLPGHVECYVYGQKGGLAFRSFDVAGADSPNGDLRITHRGSAGGLAHSAPIGQLALSPAPAAAGNGGQLAASLDSAHVCHVWKLADTTLAHTPLSFSYLATLPAPDETRCIAWLAGSSGKVILASGAGGVTLYDVLEEDKRGADPTSPPSGCEARRIGVLEGSDQLGPLRQLHTIASPRQGGTVVLGIDSDRVALWTVRLQAPREAGGSKTLYSRLSGIQPLDSGVPRITASIVCTPLSALFNLVTGHEDGTIRFWRLQLAGIELASDQPLPAFAAGDAVTSVRCAGFHRLAATSASGALTIWEAESSPSSRWRLDARLPSEGAGCRTVCEWLQVLEGSALLVVGRGRSTKIYHYTRARSMHSPFLLRWEELISLLPFTGGQPSADSPAAASTNPSPLSATSANHPVGAIGCAQSGVLLLASGPQIAVYPAHAPGGASLLGAALAESCALPAYHPHILFELMSTSRFRPAIRILHHLLRALRSLPATSSSSSGARGPLFVPDLPLADLLPLVLASAGEEAVPAKSKAKAEADAYSQLWSRPSDSSSDDDEAESSGGFGGVGRNGGGEEEGKWSEEEARELGEYLTGVRLGGVSGPEQMHLLAVAEALAKHATASQDLDPCALRFVLGQRVKSFAKPPAPLGPSDWLWALHSEAQDTLVAANVPERATWPHVRELGLALWARNPTVVRSITERLAKVAFAGVRGDRREPMEAAIWYLALDKKTALIALLKAVRDQKMLEFFSHDFSKEEWQLAALKNAYFLLGKRRYELAVTFFLLAGRDQLKAALNVCVKNLEDLHLAVWLARLIEGDGGPQLRRLLEEHLLPLAHAQADPWLESIALWLLKRYPDALSALLTSTRPAPATPSPLSSSSSSSSLSAGGSSSPAPGSPLSTSSTPTPFSQPAGVQRAVPRRRRPGEGDDLSSSRSGAMEPTLHDVPDLPKAMEQGHELGTPALLQIYRLLRANPQLRQVPQSEEDEPRLIARALYSFLHSRATLHALPLALALVPGPDDDDHHSPAALAPEMLFQRKHLLLAAVAQLLAREVLVAPHSAHADSSPVPSHLQLQLTALSSTVSPKLEASGTKAALAHMAAACAGRMARVSTQSLAVRLLPPQDAAPSLCRTLLAAAGRLAELPALSAIASVSVPVRQQLARAHIYALEVFEGLEVFEEQQRRDRMTLVREEEEAPAADGGEEDMKWKEEETAIRGCVVAGLLVAGWARGCYPAVEVLLPVATNPTALEDLAPALTAAFADDDAKAQKSENENDKKDSEDEDEDDDEENMDALQKMYAAEGLRVDRAAEAFLQAFLWLAIVNAFRRGLRDWFDLYKATLRKPTAAPVAERLIETLGGWEADLQHHLRLRTTAATAGLIAAAAARRQPERRSSAAVGPSFTSGFPLVSAVSLLIKASRLHRIEPQLPALWESLLRQKGCANHLESELAFVRGDAFKQQSQPPQRSGDGAMRVTFGDPIALYRDKDRDLLVSFAVSPSGDHIALATVSGLREVVLSPTDSRLAPSASSSLYRDEDGDEWLGLTDKSDVISSRASDTNGGSGAMAIPEASRTVLASKDRRNIIAPWVESHPTYPYYVSGGTDGAVLLWGYGGGGAKSSGSRGGPVSVFQAGGGSRVTRVRFNASGSKLGATDMAGALSLWRFDLSEEEHVGPFFKYRVHSKRALELCWINEGSVLATGGTSRAGGKRRDVALWDVLMPSPCVASWATHPGGAHSLAYSPRHQLLVSGGKEGDLCVFDLRQRVLLRTISRAHALNIKCLALAPDESLLASGSTDGAVRVWDLGGAAVLAEREHWADVHEKRTFMKPTTGFFSRPISTYGAMDVAFANGRLLSCGADGRLLSRPIFSASTRS